MKSEWLQEALSELDETLIDDVARLRQTPRKISRRYLYPVAIAACLCLTAVALLVVQSGWSRQPPNIAKPNGETAHATNASVTEVTEIQAEETVTGPYLDSSTGSTTVVDGNTTVAGNTTGVSVNTASTRTKKTVMSMESTTTIAGCVTTYQTNKTTGGEPQLLERPTVIVRIAQWQANGFMGKVVDTEDTDAVTQGETIAVRFSENIGFEVVEGEYTTFYCHAPTEKDFPADSVVTVRFVSVDASQINDDMTTIYAEGIGEVIS